jgi:hypothetical protein
MTVLMIPFTAWMPSVSLPFHSVSPYDGNFWLIRKKKFFFIPL